LVSVVYDKRVEKSMDRLRAMGLKSYIMQQDEKHAYIFIELDSVLRLISRNITYPSHKVYYDEKAKVMVIEVWKE